jgi:ABC-type spermidine/putrescine transport system permease subunit II
MSLFLVTLVVAFVSCDFSCTSFLVGTALSMLRCRLHFNGGNVAAIWGICDLLLFHLLLGIGLLLLFQEVTLTPVCLLRVVDLGLLNRLALLRGNLLGLLFRLDGLSVPNLFVLLL